jgi:hypothetical protein
MLAVNGFGAREIGSPPRREGKRGSLSGPAGSILEKYARGAPDLATSGGRRMLHLDDERSNQTKVSRAFAYLACYRNLI